MAFHSTNPFSRKAPDTKQPPQNEKPVPDEKSQPVNTDDEPPPYSASNGTNSNSLQSQPQSASSSAIPPPPPPSAPISAQAQQQPRVFETNLLLGEHSTRPLYAVSQHSGWSGNPDVILHCGPDTRMPALASAAKDFSFGNQGPNQIVLPALDPSGGGGGGGGQGLNGGGMAVVTEELCAAGGWTPNMLFSIEVGPADPHTPPPRREMFEWRHSRGDAIAGLGAAAYGYKLVRLSSDPPPGLPPGSAQFVGGGHATSDGKEVVAVFARVVGWGGGDGTRMRFRYLGTGASGLLGDRWALMAAITAIRLWQREQRNRK
ncbi:uncharacterized protein B0I36DRAFT_331675 [Microdochium trichocladiopsis]|uniref:Uncharacterized protein n=1 Tax=Microdochium trichocladiopsis TaxID=1682393 RepID=A0A9P9BIT9_9PEZI|nr:uncharacterized protein B0I36DRAFT_331675 [Microdochium trichocladiopsis]KAH7024593.1 hypothetical protein B0I36DRAFT_331675 [Microdochium trichocladiopsis]